MPIHSKFLVHWTSPLGVHKKKKPEQYTDKEDKLFVMHLESFLKNGIRMGSTSDVFETMDEESFVSGVDKICFTEMKLSHAHYFSKVYRKYGYLGLAFHRRDILKRGGNPVFYVDNFDKAGINKALRKTLSAVSGGGKHESMNSLVKTLCFLKPMREDRKDKKFLHYEDLEWRIVYDSWLEDKGVIVKRDKHYYIPIKPGDLKFIIFPRNETRVKSLKLLGKYYKDSTDKLPALLTVNETTHF